MVLTKNMKNADIYTLASMILSSFTEEIILPVKVNFYLQKNKNKIINLGREIEESRVLIFNKYGNFDQENSQYNFPPENVDIVNSELKDLMELSQEVKINMIPLEAFDGIELSENQMSAISFMIYDSEEDEE